MGQPVPERCAGVVLGLGGDQVDARAAREVERPVSRPRDAQCWAEGVQRHRADRAPLRPDGLEERGRVLGRAQRRAELRRVHRKVRVGARQQRLADPLRPGRPVPAREHGRHIEVEWGRGHDPAAPERGGPLLDDLLLDLVRLRRERVAHFRRIAGLGLPQRAQLRLRALARWGGWPRHVDGDPSVAQVARRRCGWRLEEYDLEVDVAVERRSQRGLPRGCPHQLAGVADPSVDRRDGLARGSGHGPSAEASSTSSASPIVGTPSRSASSRFVPGSAPATT